jgi:hypothetical protein
MEQQPDRVQTAVDHLQHVWLRLHGDLRRERVELRAALERRRQDDPVAGDGEQRLRLELAGVLHAKAASVTYVSSTKLKATVPGYAATGTISVTNTAAPVGTVTSARSFTA